MPFKDFASGAMLTAAEVDTYLMQQAVIVCTSATRPGSPVEGMRIVETDTDKEYWYDGSTWQESNRIAAWTAYTPTWTNVTIGNATVDAAYKVMGKSVTYRGSVIVGGTTLITGNVQASLPVNAKALSGAVGRQVGKAHYEDTGTQFYGGSCSATSGATIIGFHHVAVGNSGNVNATNPITFATGDGIYWYIEYEAA